MTLRQMENRVKKLKAIEEQQKALEAEADKIKAEIKTEMQTQGKDEIHTGNFIVRLKEVVANRFDSKSFAKEHKSLYEAYTRSQSYQRFTVA